MSSRSSIYILSLFATSALSVQASPAFATAAATASDPQSIIVTGRTDEYVTLESTTATKTETPLVDVPQSISIISEEQIHDQALRDIGDVLRYVPGASIGQGEGNRDQFTIRGQNSTADFYIDGLRDDVQYFRPLYNLDRIEILKGANALIFGRGGGGGVINRVTKSPSALETFGSAEIGVDTLGSYSISGDVNVALGSDAGVRLNAFYEELDNHRDFFSGERFALNPTFAASLGPDTKVKISYEYVDDDRVVDRGIPSVGNRPLQGFRDTFFGDPDANVTTLQAHIARARIEHDFSTSVSANATVQYADYDKLYQNLYPVGIDLVAGTVTLDGYSDTTDRQNFIIQGNIVADVTTGPFAHTLLLGYEYGNQQSDNARRDALFASSGRDSATFAFSDPLAIPAFAFPAVNRDRSSDVDFLSFYLQDQIDIGEHIKIVGGVRYDRFEIDVTDRAALASGKPGSFGRTDDKFSPRVGLIYKPMDNISLYGSYSQSFLPRSGDQFLSLSPTTEALAPEEFENYEIGAKWNIRPDLAFTAAVFRLDRKNGVVADPNNVGNSILSGTRTEGFELQLTGRVLPDWQVNAGYSYLDGTERGRFDGTGVEANRDLSQVPQHLASLWNRYDVSDALGFGLGVTYQSSQFTSISNSVKLPGFTRIDAAVFYKVSDTLELQINVENLTDETYFPAAHNDNNISTGEPINARFTVRARF